MAVDKTEVFYQLGRVNKFAFVSRIYEIDVIKSLGIEPPKSKKRRRYFRHYVRKYSEIDQQFDLGLTHEEIRSAAFSAADNKAMASMQWYQSIFSGNGLQGILSVVALVIAVVVNIIPGVGQLASATAFSAVFSAVSSIVAGVGAVAGVIAGQYAKHVGNRVTGMSGIAQALGAAISFRRASSTAQSNSLTHLIIYGGYAIYPNNSIYKQGAASQQDYVNTIAYDPTKGIRGDLPQDKIGEKIHSRYGGDLAGGINHHSNIMELEIPLESFTFGAGDLLDSSGDKLQNYNKRINKGFAALAENDFNADKKLESKYKRVIEVQTRPIKQYMKSVDFLDKLQNYSKNLMADFNFLHENNFKMIPTNKGSRVSYTMFLQSLSSYFEILDTLANENLYVLKNSLMLDLNYGPYRMVLGYEVIFTQNEEEPKTHALQTSPYFPSGLVKADKVFIKPEIIKNSEEDEANFIDREDENRLRIWDLDFLDGFYKVYRENYYNDEFVMPKLEKEEIFKMKKELETLCYENLAYIEYYTQNFAIIKINTLTFQKCGIVIKNPNKTLYYKNDNGTFTTFTADYFFIVMDEDNFKIFKDPIPKEYLDEDSFNEKAR